jgi:hypothetical protein
LGIAVGYAGWASLGRIVAAPVLATCAAGAAAVYLLSSKLLARLGGGREFSIAAFVPGELVVEVAPELVLGDADRLSSPELLLTHADRVPSEPGASEPLLLDDVLAELGPDSRVVRLFDPAKMPTPGQLNARIRQHLGGACDSAAPPDDSEALHEALAALRQSLR